MRKNKAIGLILLTIFLVGCSSKQEEIDPVSGMPTMFCPILKDSIEEANDALWTLGVSTTLPDFKESLLEVIEQPQTINIVSVSPASDWLQQISVNATDFLVYFSGPGEEGSSQLMDIASRWKGSYEQLDDFCK